MAGSTENQLRQELDNLRERDGPTDDNPAVLTSGHNGPETSPLVADFNRQDYRLMLRNDLVAVLGSADDYARYAGAEFGAV